MEMARCINVLIAFSCVISFFSRISAGALKVCELCSTGVACYVGVEDPLKGQCASSCDACAIAGYEGCQNCQKECIALHSSAICNDPLECCGSMSKQTTCENKRCCTTKGTFCSGPADCCIGLRCSASTDTCVFDAAREVETVSDLFDSEAFLNTNSDMLAESYPQRDTAFIEKLKETTAKLADMVDENNDLIEQAKSDAAILVNKKLAGKIKGDTEKLLGRGEPDNADTDLLGKLRSRTAQVANQVKLEKENVVGKVKEKEDKLVGKVKSTTAELTDAMKADAASLADNLKLTRLNAKEAHEEFTLAKPTGEVNEKIQSVFNEVDKDSGSQPLKAKVNAILDVDKEKVRGGIGNLKTKMDDMLSVGNADELSERIDEAVKEDREKVKARMEETRVKMDETKKSIGDWTTTHLGFRDGSETASILSDLEVCFETNAILVKESSTMNRLIKDVKSVFDDISNGLEEIRSAERNAMQKFFHNLALDPRRSEELFHEENPDSTSDSEGETAEKPESLYEMCKTVTAQLEKQKEQLTKVLNALMDMLKAVYNSDLEKLEAKSASLLNYISDMVKSAIEPADGTTSLVNWSEVLSSLPEVDSDFLWNLKVSDDRKTPNLLKPETWSKQNNDETLAEDNVADERATEEGDAEEFTSEEEGDAEEFTSEEDGTKSTFLKLPQIKDLKQVLPSAVVEVAGIEILPALDLLEQNTSTEIPAITEQPIVFQSTSEDNNNDNATESAESLTAPESNFVKQTNPESLLTRGNPDHSIRDRIASLSKKLIDLQLDLETID